MVPRCSELSDRDLIDDYLPLSLVLEPELLLSREPFGGKAELISFRSSIDASIDYAVAIPLRNEEALLPRALTALRRAMLRADPRGAVLFCINDTRDGSPAIVADWLRDSGVPGAAVEVAFTDGIRNAPHARRVAMDLGAQVSPSGVLLTSDADTHVGAGWVRGCLATIEEGHDFVCEDVRLDEAELSLLPEQVRKVGDAERAYFKLSEKLWNVWTEGQAGAFAYRASGASMAIRTPFYRAIGGLPLPAVGEDAALCAAVLHNGGRIAMLDDLGTRTSARLHSRAGGGCGQALADRAREADPLCDASLMPVADLHRRARRWMFDAEDVDEPEARETTPTPAPMRYSDILRELEVARSLLACEDRTDA